MGRSIAVVGSMTSGHDGFPPVPVVEGSDFVTCNGIPVAVVGSKCAPHSKPKHGTHTPIVTGGSSFIKINGIPVAMVGSEVSGNCGTSSHVIVTGCDTCQIEE